ncbi:hypothetical protein GGI24_000117 [Coemansia furcata]|nr:hypothetical protein GGI24_000117 [Coemansia furcata]
MAPIICEVEVVGTSNPVNLPSDHTRINDFLSQIFQLVPRVVYKGSEDNIPLGLPAVKISHLVHIDIDFDPNSLYKPLFSNLAQWNMASQLAHQNAMTLQYLSIGTYSWAHITGIVKDDNGYCVSYPRLSVLKLKYSFHTYEHYWPVFAEVVPFPRLRQLTIAGKYPFGDDILFRGNAATLECLDISLDSGMVTTLKRYNVFTSISHPKLRCVKIGLEPGVGVEQFETVTARLQFMLDIGPAATVRELKNMFSDPWLSPVLPVFANYTNIQILVLTGTRLTLWNTIALIDMLPLLSELYSQSPVVGPLPAKVSKDGLLDYVVATHVSMSKTFRFWHITYEDKWVSGGETISCVLLLALICPNFDYVFAGSNRDLFMTHLKVAMAAETFLPYAARLQRLLPGRPANENSDIKAI